MTPRARTILNSITLAATACTCLLAGYTAYVAHEIRREVNERQEARLGTVDGIRVSQIAHAKVVSTFAGKDPQFGLVRRVMYVDLKDGATATVDDRDALLLIVLRLGAQHVEFETKTLDTE